MEDKKSGPEKRVWRCERFIGNPEAGILQFLNKMNLEPQDVKICLSSYPGEYHQRVAYVYYKSVIEKPDLSDNAGKQHYVPADGSHGVRDDGY